MRVGASSGPTRARSTNRPIRHERLLEPLVRGRVAHPHVALARRPEGTARDDRDVLLDQQPLGELPRRQARSS